MKDKPIKSLIIVILLIYAVILYSIIAGLAIDNLLQSDTTKAFACLLATLPIVGIAGMVICRL